MSFLFKLFENAYMLFARYRVGCINMLEQKSFICSLLNLYSSDNVNYCNFLTVFLSYFVISNVYCFMLNTIRIRI